MIRYVRARCEATIDNPEAKTLLFDLLLDDAGAISGEHLIFGYQLDPEDRISLSRPIVVHENGRVDFGDAYKNSTDRYGQTDLREKPVAEGVLVRLWGSGYDDVFRVKQLRTLCSQP